MLRLFCFLFISAFTLQLSAQLQPVELRVEHMVNPSVVEEMTPRLSWYNKPSSTTARGEQQTAYRICVASSREGLLHGDIDVWDSGKCKSSDSYLIPYSGPVLKSLADYWWHVQVWDKKGKVSEWSAPAHWGMGIVDSSLWKAQWIQTPWEDGCAPQFRKTITIDKPIAKAKMVVTGLGYVEPYINGSRVGDDYFVPNFTNYTSREGLDKYMIVIDENFTDYRVLYLSYDVTSNLRMGQNVLGMMLGNGFFSCGEVRWVCTFGHTAMLCQLHITYLDGTEEIIGSDTSWKVRKSAIVMNGPYQGEVYDANQEEPLWCQTELNDATWQNAVLAKVPDGKLTAQMSPADKITEVLNPKSLTRCADGGFEVDFGKEISGWIRMKNIRGKAGTTIRVKYICESPLGVHEYICKDDSPVNYAPRFTWYVFSKAIVYGVDALEAQQLQAEAVNTDVPVVSEFKSSNALIDRIHEIWEQSQLDNMHGCIASDCPHRERSPYTGDGQAASSMVMSNFDAAAFYRKWMRDMRDVQNAQSGYVPNSAPWQPGCGGGVAWGAAMNIIPWEYYLYYGDKKVLAENYDAMCNQIKYMLTWQTPEGTMLQKMANVGTSTPNKWLNLGDWSPAFGFPSDELVHTFYLWLCLHNTSLAARALGKHADESNYAGLAAKVAQAFHTKFYNADHASYGDFGSNVYALYMGVPQEFELQVVETLRKEIMETYTGHINTGFLAARYLFEVLGKYGLNEVAYSILSKTDFPSFGHWIAQGATVTWEQFDGKNSRNHPMFGGGLIYLYRYLAGVKIDENNPGYKQFEVSPELPSEMDSASYSMLTPYGKVYSAVKKTNLGLQCDVVVPVGTSALLKIPFSEKDNLFENNRKCKTRKCKDEKYAVFPLLQGSYQFVLKKN